MKPTIKVLNKNYLGQEAWFYIRPDTNDQLIMDENRISDQYGLSKLGKFKPNDIVIDIGGHIGIFAIECAVRGANVISFEPNPENYEIFLKNIEVNKFEDKITVYNKAIADKAGTAYLYLDDINPGSHSLIENCVDHPGDNKVMVDTVTLDSITENIKWVTLIKLDCEGLEYKILTNSDLKKVERITAELHASKYINLNFIDRLTQRGYFIKWNFNGRMGRMSARRW